MNEHTCPVCGYSDDADFYPRDHQICGCCGTEFGYDDRVFTHRQLRSRWIAAGFPWFDPAEPRPLNWNAYLQLLNAGLVQFAVENNTTNTQQRIVEVHPNRIIPNWTYAY